MSTPVNQTDTSNQQLMDKISRPAVKDIAGFSKRRLFASINQEKSKRLLVGKEIYLSGKITTCDSLLVEGNVEADLENSHYIEITETGFYRGKAIIKEAAIAGRFEGELSVHGTLSVKATGIIAGNIRFNRLEVELGGVIKGDISPFTKE
ncbi:bactofilin family protein [Candidatus Endolissoclinum faulkneri]|nr:polymer-forming cytoskeletal protein [Candidatus Endolissoclinum faulkneri]